MSETKTQPDDRPKAGSLTEWKKRRRHNGVRLPSGMVVDIELPDMPQLAKAGQIPDELMKASGKLQEAIESKDASNLTVETLVNIAEFMEFLLPQMVVNPTLTKEQVEEIPTEDKEMLVAFAQRARDIDAVGKHLAGLEELAEWRRFRGWELASEDLGG